MLSPLTGVRKKYPTKILIAQIRPRYIIDFFHAQIIRKMVVKAISAPSQINLQFSVAKNGPPSKTIKINNKITAYKDTFFEIHSRRTIG